MQSLEASIKMHRISKLSLKGIYVSLGIYAVFYMVFWNIANSTLASKSSILLLIVFYLMQVICGFVAGRIAKLSGWLNGMVVGLGVPVINALVNEIFPGYELIYIPPGDVFIRQLVAALICCCIGGFIADFLRKTK